MPLRLSAHPLATVPSVPATAWSYRCPIHPPIPNIRLRQFAAIPHSPGAPIPGQWAIPRLSREFPAIRSLDHLRSVQPELESLWRSNNPKEYGPKEYEPKEHGANASRQESQISKRYAWQKNRQLSRPSVQLYVPRRLLHFQSVLSFVWDTQSTTPRRLSSP